MGLLMRPGSASALRYWRSRPSASKPLGLGVLRANDQFGQGRYFFPVAAPVAFLLVRGLQAFGELVKKGAGQRFVAGMVLAEVLLLTYAVWRASSRFPPDPAGAASGSMT